MIKELTTENYPLSLAVSYRQRGSKMISWWWCTTKSIILNEIESPGVEYVAANITAIRAKLE